MALTYALKTFGCQMNYSDSERVTTVLKKMGYEPAPAEEKSDLIILNTCSVKQKAHERVYGLQELFLEWKEKNPKLKIGITGCMTRESGVRGESKDEIFRRMETVDFVFQIKDLMQLPGMLQKVHQIELSDAADIKDLTSYFHISPTVANIAQVFIPIMSGCNNYCSFCIVPYTRGKEIYRPMAEILDEVEKYAKRGAKEVNLVGQNVDTYRPNDADLSAKEKPFVQLLRKIDAVPGIDRIRFYTVHPKDMTDDVIALYGTLRSMVPHLHLPLQSGSDTTLKRMNRWYNTARFRELIQKMRTRIPHMSLSTDIIVGFCGETEEEFMESYNLVKELKIDLCYISKYSVRKGTLADRTLKDDIPLSVKKDREKRLTDLVKQISHEYNQQFLGKTVKVLVERVEKGYASGKIPEFKMARFPAEDKNLIGKYVDIKVTDALEWCLDGKPI